MSCAFNISKGKIQYYFETARDRPAGFTNAGIIIHLLKATGLEADSTLTDHDNVSVLLASTNDEADFTNYVRKTVFGSGGTGITITVDDSGNRVLLDLPDQTWTDAGGNPVVTNNTLGKVLISFDPDTTGGTDTALIPLLAHDITATTDGNDLIVRFHVDGAARVV